MALNLITDAWIPMVTAAGGRRVIAPWEMSDPALLRPAWPRADLNIACLELLIGLLFLVAAPVDDDDWCDNPPPAPEQLRARLQKFAPAFNLTGDGPCFLQDLAALDGAPNAPDMLFLDSAGGQTRKHNADLMVWRDRYPALAPELAAMALYALQAFAPSGGAGNRTSMRGGGPMTTLIAPRGSLWQTIRANVPNLGARAPATPADLPWMRATATSEKGQQVYPQQRHPVEAFFGMPRRLRLVADDGLVTGVIQRPYGTNYAGWEHPLSPYYRLKIGEEWLPRHPKPGRFGYRNWLGVVIAGARDDAGTSLRAASLRNWLARAIPGTAPETRLLVAGWATDNMKPLDYTLSTPPLLRLDEDAAGRLRGLVRAADSFARALALALKPVLAEGETREAVREAFYTETEARFEQLAAQLAAGAVAEPVARQWLSHCRSIALGLFDARALPGLADRKLPEQKAIIDARRLLHFTFTGHGKMGREAFDALWLPLPAAPKDKAA